MMTGLSGWSFKMTCASSSERGFPALSADTYSILSKFLGSKDLEASRTSEGFVIGHGVAFVQLLESLSRGVFTEIHGRTIPVRVIGVHRGTGCVGQA